MEAAISTCKTDLLKVKWNQQTYEVEVCFRQDTVMDLKRKLYKLTHLLPQDQHLWIELKKKKQTQKWELREDATILSTIKLLNKNIPLFLTGDVREGGYKVKKVLVNVDVFLLPQKQDCKGNSVNQQKLSRLVKDSQIEEVDGPRKDKKLLLVLDGDFVIYGNHPKMDCTYMQELHLFLGELYHYYDIMIWTAYSLKWIKSKMEYLDIPRPHYKIAALLDLSLMMSVQSSSDVLECKPLKVIWAKYPQYEPKRTVMLDCLEPSFAMNPTEGLLVEPLNQLVVGARKQLLKYLVCLADAQKNENFDHSNWRSYSTPWRGWARYVRGSYDVEPFIFIDKKINETNAVCHLSCDTKCHVSCGKKYIISRVDETYRPFIHSLQDFGDKNLFKILHLSCDKGNRQVCFIGENHETFIDWMHKNEPLNAKRELDTNKFVTNFRSLLNSTICAIIATRFADFHFSAADVCVVERKGKKKLVVGLVIVEQRDGPLKCLQDLSSIVEEWFNHHGCPIPVILSELLLVLKNWSLQKFKGDSAKTSALRMISKHPVFFPANRKIVFDDIVKLDSEIKSGNFPGDLGKELKQAFHFLMYREVKDNTPWYVEAEANAVIKRSVAKGRKHGGVSNNIPGLVKDLRNLASHLYQNTGSAGKRSNNTVGDYNRCFDNVDSMLHGCFSAIHLCIINVGLSYVFLKDE